MKGVFGLVLVVGVGLVSGIYMEGRLRAWLMGRVETELLAQARVGRDLVELLPGVASDARLEAVIRDTIAIGPTDWVVLVPNSAYSNGGKMLA